MHYYTTGDYSSRYRGTYIAEVRDEILVPQYVLRVEPDPIRFHLREVKSDGSWGRETLKEVTDDSLILHPPKLGLVQNGGELFYIRRKPHRRWKQGLSLDSCAIRWYVQDKRTEEVGVNVHKVFNSDRTSLDQAKEQVFEVPRRACSITRSVGMVPSTEEGMCHVVHKTRKVGEYFQRNDTLVLLPGFHALADTMRRAGFLTIEVHDD